MEKSKFKISGHEREDGEQRNLPYRYLHAVDIRTSILVEIQKLKIEAVVNIVNGIKAELVPVYTPPVYRNRSADQRFA